MTQQCQRVPPWRRRDRVLRWFGWHCGDCWRLEREPDPDRRGESGPVRLVLEKDGYREKGRWRVPRLRDVTVEKKNG